MINKKRVLGIAAAIVLGALGSGLWELCRPALTLAGTAIVETSTLGLTSLRNALYEQAATSLGRPTSIGLWTTRTNVLLLLCAGLGFLLFRASYQGNRQAMGPMRRAPELFTLLAVIELVVLARTQYVGGLANHYERLVVLAAPVLSDDEVKRSHAAFSQIKSREQFLAVIAPLTERAKQAGNTPPERDFI